MWGVGWNRFGVNLDNVEFLNIEDVPRYSEEKRIEEKCMCLGCCLELSGAYTNAACKTCHLQFRYYKLL